MDYRSSYELRQQLMEEARVAQGSAGKAVKRGAEPVIPAAPPSANSSSTPFMPSTVLPDDPTALVREVPGAENIKALNEALEHEEAVQRYVEKSNLTFEESAKYIMTHGSTGQRLSLFRQCRTRFADLNQRRVSTVLAILLDSMWTQDPELQCQAPVEVLGLLEHLGTSTLAELLEATKTMLSVKTASVRKAWGELLRGLVEHLSVEQVEKTLVPFVLAQTDHGQPQDLRELSCDMLGAACPHLGRERVEALVLKRALALCQDTNVGVRQHMCQQLGVIARSLGVEVAKAQVAPDLFELLSDEERAVSRTAFSCLIDLVGFFGPEFRKERLYPIIKSYISDPPSEVVTLLVGEFGRFLDAIKGDIDTHEDVVLFANFFHTSSEGQDTEARRHCAFNLPAVAASLPYEVFPLHISPVLHTLASDEDALVRISIAAGLHELVGILGPNAAAHLEAPFKIILQDDNPRVRVLCSQHAPTLLDCFVSQMRPAHRRAFFWEVAQTFLKVAPKRSTDWRFKAAIISLLEAYQAHFDEDVLMEHFVPLLLNQLTTGAAALKNDCARLVMRIIARSNNVHSSVKLLNKLNSDFAKSDSCYQRQSYFRFVREGCVLFSRRFVRERLLGSCLEMQQDPVSCVRLALASNLDLLAAGLRPSQPGTLDEEFSRAMQALLEDKNAEVAAAARHSKALMERVVPERRRMSSRAEALEIEDAAREKLELPMLEMAKDMEKAERRAKLRDLLRNEREREHTELPNPAPRRTAPQPRRKTPTTHQGRLLPPIAAAKSPRVPARGRKKL